MSNISRLIELARGDYFKRYAKDSDYSQDPNARTVRDAVFKPTPIDKEYQTPGRGGVHGPPERPEVRKARTLASRQTRSAIEAMVQADIKTDLTGKHTAHRKSIDDAIKDHQAQTGYIRSQGLNEEAAKRDAEHKLKIKATESKYSDSILGRNKTDPVMGTQAQTAKTAKRQRRLIKGAPGPRKMSEADKLSVLADRDKFGSSMAAELRERNNILRGARKAAGATNIKAANAKFAPIMAGIPASGERKAIPGLRDLVSSEVAKRTAGDSDRAANVKRAVKAKAEARMGRNVTEPEILKTRVNEVTKPIFSPAALGGEAAQYDRDSIASKLGLKGRNVDAIKARYSLLANQQATRKAQVTSQVIKEGKVFEPIRSATHASRSYPALNKNLGKIKVGAAGLAAAAIGTGVAIERRIKAKREKKKELVQFALKLSPTGAERAAKRAVKKALPVLQGKGLIGPTLTPTTSIGSPIGQVITEKKAMVNGGLVNPEEHVAILKSRIAEMVNDSRTAKGFLKSRVQNQQTAHEKLVENLRDRYTTEASTLKSDFRKVRSHDTEVAKKRLFIGTGAAGSVGAVAGYETGRPSKRKEVQFSEKEKTSTTRKLLIGGGLLAGAAIGARTSPRLLRRGRAMQEGESLLGKVVYSNQGVTSAADVIHLPGGRSLKSILKKASRSEGMKGTAARAALKVDSFMGIPQRHYGVGVGSGRIAEVSRTNGRRVVPEESFGKVMVESEGKILKEPIRRQHEGRSGTMDDQAAGAFNRRYEEAQGSNKWKKTNINICSGTNCESYANNLAGFGPKTRQINSIITGGVGGALVGGAATSQATRKKKSKGPIMFSSRSKKDETLRGAARMGISSGVTGAAGGLILGLAGTGEGRAFGKTNVLKALKSAGKWGGGLAAAGAGGALIGSAILGAPKRNEGAAYTKRGAIGGGVAGAIAGGTIGALALRNKWSAGIIAKYARDWRPLQVIQKSGAFSRAAIGATAGGAAGAAQLADEGQQVDTLNSATRKKQYRMSSNLQPIQFAGLPVAQDRYRKAIREKEGERADSNYLRSAAAGTTIAALLRRKTGLAIPQALLTGAGIGVASQAAMRATSAKDAFGDRSYNDKRKERLPWQAGGLVATGLLARRAGNKLRDLKVGVSRTGRNIRTGALVAGGAYLANRMLFNSIGKPIEFAYDPVADALRERSQKDRQKRSSMRAAEDLYRKAGRGKRLARDASLALKGEKSVDSRGRERVPEWQKPWVKQAVGLGIAALAIRKARGSYRGIKEAAAAQKQATGEAHGIPGAVDRIGQLFKRSDTYTHGGAIVTPYSALQSTLKNKIPRSIAKPALAIRREIRNTVRDTKAVINDKVDDVVNRWTGTTPGVEAARVVAADQNKVKKVKDRLKQIRAVNAGVKPGKLSEFSVHQFATTLDDWDISHRSRNTAIVRIPGGQKRDRRQKDYLETAAGQRMVRNIAIGGSLAAGAGGAAIFDRHMNSVKNAAMAEGFKDHPSGFKVSGVNEAAEKATSKAARAAKFAAIQREFRQAAKRFVIKASSRDPLITLSVKLDYLIS